MLSLSQALPEHLPFFIYLALPERDEVTENISTGHFERGERSAEHNAWQNTVQNAVQMPIIIIVKIYDVAMGQHSIKK